MKETCCGSLCLSFQMRLFNLHNEAQAHSHRLNYSETTNKNEYRQAPLQTYKSQYVTLSLELFFCFGRGKRATVKKKSTLRTCSVPTLTQ